MLTFSMTCNCSRARRINSDYGMKTTDYPVTFDCQVILELVAIVHPYVMICKLRFQKPGTSALETKCYLSAL